MTRKPSDGSERQSINVRTRVDLKQRLERIASGNGRSLAQEVERRLEQSLEEKAEKLGDPLPGIFSDEVRRALRGSPPLAELVEAVADVVLHTIRAANDRGRSEVEVRTAIRASLNVVADDYLWRGEKTETPVEAPLAPLGARKIDYPPAHMGYEMARHRLLYLSAWREDAAAVDKAEGRIRDLYSGAGRTVLMGPTPEEAAAERDAKAAEARSALAAGEVEYEDPARIPGYKQTRADPPQRDTEEGAPPQSLKDIMGR